jgi:hypothetical protein
MMNLRGFGWNLLWHEANHNISVRRASVLTEVRTQYPTNGILFSDITASIAAPQGLMSVCGEEVWDPFIDPDSMLAEA